MSDAEEVRHDPIELDGDSDLGALIALAGLPGLAPGRLWSLLALGRPQDVWQRVARGGAPGNGRANDAARNWPDWCARIDPSLELARHRDSRAHVAPFGHQDYPAALHHDPDPPAVIFARGSLPIRDRTRVAIVGTRQCSAYGRRVAQQLGTALAERGVDVVSGLASGIDASAHAGAILADPDRTIAVVAGGVDIVYPQRNRALFAQIADRGTLLSEWPLRARPEPWRFPARNRIVAALSAAVVVVESALQGGSMYTVDEALERDRAVFAVPGPIYSRSSRGTNKLIADGAHSLHDMDELLDVVAPRSAPMATQIELGVDSWLLQTIGWQAMDLESVAHESGRSPGDVVLEVERLIGAGVVRRMGAVIERVA